jgi:hypothetical protein
VSSLNRSLHDSSDNLAPQQGEYDEYGEGSQKRASHDDRLLWDVPRSKAGQKKSFHEARNVSIPNTAIAGRAIGTTIDRKMRNVEAPSTQPASRISVGMAFVRYWRMKNTPKADTSVGSTTDWRWFTQCSLAISRNSGMTPSCGGIAIVAIVSASNGRLPRKRSFANAKPLRVQNSTVPIAVQPDTIREFTTALSSGCSCSASRMLWNIDEFGRNGGGTCAISWFVCDAMIIV